jgi:hypothetical protein
MKHDPEIEERKTDTAIAARYEAALARVESREIDRRHADWLAAHREMTARVQLRWIVATRRWTYSWNRADQRIRRLRTTSGHSNRELPPTPKRCYRVVAGIMAPEPIDDMEEVLA